MDIHQHNEEIEQNLRYWQKKPVLRKVYRHFHRLIAQHMADLSGGHVVELGSGIGKIKDTIPQCIITDLFPNPWIDQVENAYALSFPDHSVSDLILFDVFHHLRYPGTALQEFHRVLLPGGRVIIFDPCTASLLGLMVYGMFHHEPLRRRKPVQWFAPQGWNPESIEYFAAQANASRIFFDKESEYRLAVWNIMTRKRLSALSYVLSGGFSKPQLYPGMALPIVRALERICDPMPSIFATRVLVVLEKTNSAVNSTAID